VEPGDVDSNISGDAVRLATYVERYGDRLVQFAYTFLHDWEGAQDMAQDTVLRAVASRRHLTPGWLFTVAHHLAIDEVRRRRVGPVADVEPETNGPDSGLAFLGTDALRHLGRRDRECLWLFYYGGLSLH
jgi:DNA-directed RNA polymerase specialized sigma24 family protein